MVNLKQYIFSTTVLSVSLLLQPSLAQHWPNPDSLLLFLPFDAENGLRDIANGINPYFTDQPQLETSKPGPFGIANSSYTPSCTNCYISHYRTLPKIDSFTLSTYFYVSERQQKGALFWIYGSDYIYKISLIYNGKALEVHLFGNGWFHSTESFTISNFFNDWTFICLTYDDSTKTVTLYNQLGNPIYIKNNFPIPSNKDTFLYVGYANDETTQRAMVTGDAVACTMIYSEILSPYEIAELPKVCYRKGKEPASPEPWPEPQQLIGLWPLSQQYELGLVNGQNTFQPVSV